MRLIKLAIFSFVLLFLLVTGISLFIPSRVRISRAINIMAEREAILAPLKDPARWKEWHPGLDSAKLLEVNGQVKGLTLDASDTKKPVTLVITRIDTAEVETLFTPKKLKPINNVWRTISHPGSDSVTVQWYMDFNLRWYPWEKFGSLVLEKSHGSNMEKGLNNLRKLVQSH